MTAAVLAAVSTLSQKRCGKDQQSILEIVVEPFFQGRLLILLVQLIGESTGITSFEISPDYGHRLSHKNHQFRSKVIKIADLCRSASAL